MFPEEIEIMTAIRQRRLNQRYYGVATKATTEVKLSCTAPKGVRERIGSWIQALSEILLSFKGIPCEGTLDFVIAHYGYKADGTLFVFDDLNLGESRKIFETLYAKLGECSTLNAGNFSVKFQVTVKVSQIKFCESGGVIDFKDLDTEPIEAPMWSRVALPSRMLN